MSAAYTTRRAERHTHRQFVTLTKVPSPAPQAARPSHEWVGHCLAYAPLRMELSVHRINGAARSLRRSELGLGHVPFEVSMKSNRKDRGSRR